MERLWIEDIKEFHGIAEGWDEAIIASGEENPFLLSDFIESWWKYHSKNRRLSIFAIYDRGQIIAGIPLCIRRINFRRTITHMGGPDANVTHFFSKNNQLNFIEHLMSSLEKRDDWDILVLDRVLTSHPLIKHIKGSKSLNTNLYVYYLFDAGFNGIIDLTQGYKEVLENLSKRLKRYLRRSKEEISKIGELKLHRIGGTSDVRSLFKAYRELSVRAFRTRNKLSAFEDKNRCRFYEELLIRLDKKNRLDAHKLTIGASTLGISFGYRFGKGFKWILTAYNPDFYQLRPGHLLIEALINEAINSGDPYFDMYYGGEAFYKQQWCPKLIPLKRIEICRNHFLNRSLSLTRHALRSNKIFMNTARKVRRIVHKILT